MQIACRGTFSPFLCTAGYIARGGQDVARTRYVRIQSVRIRLARAHMQWLCRAGTVNICALPIRLARRRYKAAVICAEFLWTGSLESKKPDFSGFPRGCHGCRGLLSAYSLQSRAGLIFAVIVTAVPAVVSAGVAVPAAGCVGAVVLRVILLWFPDRVNDEPDDQNDRGDNPDPYAG